MRRRQVRALYINGWHRLFEPTYLKTIEIDGKKTRVTGYRQGNPGSFTEQIHTGERRRELIRRHGVRGALERIGLYDQLRQLAAAQPVERRGWLVDSFGSALTVAQIASILENFWQIPSQSAPGAHLSAQIDDLVAAKWLRWAVYRAQPKEPTIPAARTYPRKNSEPGPHRVRTAVRPIHNKTDRQQVQETDIDKQPSPDCRPDSGAVNGEAPGFVVSSVLSPSGNGDRQKARGLLRLTFGLAKAEAMLSQHPEWSHRRIAQAHERAIIMRDHGKLRSTFEAYVHGDLLDGPYTLPSELQRFQKIHDSGVADVAD